MPDEEEQDLLHALETPVQLATPVKKFKLTGLKYTIKNCIEKAPGHDLITGRILKELPNVEIRVHSFIY